MAVEDAVSAGVDEPSVKREEGCEFEGQQGVCVEQVGVVGGALFDCAGTVDDDVRVQLSEGSDGISCGSRCESLVKRYELPDQIAEVTADDLA